LQLIFFVDPLIPLPCTPLSLSHLLAFPLTHHSTTFGVAFLVIFCSEEVTALSPRQHNSHLATVAQIDSGRSTIHNSQPILNSEFQERFQPIFDYFEFTSDGHKSARSDAELIKIAHDLTDYDHLPLAAKAFQFLLAAFSQERKLHHLLKNTSIVVDNETKVLVEEVHVLCDAVRLKNRYAMKIDDAHEILKALRYIVKIANHEGWF
jgi:hypothetical protein